MKNCPSSSYSVLGSVMKAQTVSAVGVLSMGIVLMSVSLNIDFVIFAICVVSFEVVFFLGFVCEVVVDAFEGCVIVSSSSLH